MPSIGTVTLGSFTLEPRVGNPDPNSFWDPETKTGFNAIGLRNQGLEAFFVNEAPLLRQLWQGTTTQMDLSLAPTAEGELRKLCTVMNRHKGVLPIRYAQVNGACPNHRKGGTNQPILAHDPEAVERLFMELKKCPYPISFKIAPETTEATLHAIVNLCIKYGVEKIDSGNTKGEEAVWNGKPVLSVERGGKSGKPLFARAVEQVAILKAIIASKHLSSPIKVEGIGGIFTPADAVTMQNAGADGVSAASLFYFDGGWKSVAKLSRDFHLR